MIEPFISLCMIVKNEEKNLPRALESVRWADEIIVVDSGSTDRSTELAEKAGARVIRNPWLFRQIREHQRGEAVFIPRGKDVLAYVRALYEAVCSPAMRESAQVQKMKKYMNYLGVGVEPTGQFLHLIRRVTTTADLFRVCEEYLGHDRPMPLEPFPLESLNLKGVCKQIESTGRS